MWGPIIRVIALVGGGLAMGEMMQDPPQVIVHSAPPPPPAAVAATHGLSPMLVVACAILVAAIGYTIWMFRRSS